MIKGVTRINITRKLRQQLKGEQELRVALSRKIVELESEIEQYRSACGEFMREAFLAEGKRDSIRPLWMIKRLAQLFHRVSYFHW